MQDKLNLKLLKKVWWVFFVLVVLETLLILFSTPVLNPTVSIVGFKIHWYGLCMAIAVLVGMLLGEKILIHNDVSSNRVESLLYGLVVFGFIGSRVYHVLSDFGLYSENIINVFAVWNGGLSVYGALVGGLFWLIWWQKKTSSSLLGVLDLLVVPFLFGQMVARQGNWFNYELMGPVTQSVLGVFIPSENVFRFPLFLIEIWFLIFLVPLLVKVKQKFVFSGAVFFVYLFCYSIFRFYLEHLRLGSDDLLVWSANQMLNLICGIFAFFGIIVAYVKKPLKNTA